MISLLKDLFRRQGQAELSIDDVLRFTRTAGSAVATAHFREWQLARLFDGLDGRRYVRMIAVADRTITKVLPLEALLTEHFTARSGEPPDTLLANPSPAQPRPEPPLPLRSRRARAAARHRAASAAE